MTPKYAIGTMLAALLLVGLAPAATAHVSVDVDNPFVECESIRIGTGSAIRDEVYTEDCDVHAEKNGPAFIDCRTTDLGTGPAFSFRVGSERGCHFYVRA